MWLSFSLMILFYGFYSHMLWVKIINTFGFRIKKRMFILWKSNMYPWDCINFLLYVFYDFLLFSIWFFFSLSQINYFSITLMRIYFKYNTSLQSYIINTNRKQKDEKKKYICREIYYLRLSEGERKKKIIDILWYPLTTHNCLLLLIKIKVLWLYTTKEIIKSII